MVAFLKLSYEIYSNNYHSAAEFNQIRTKMYENIGKSIFISQEGDKSIPGQPSTLSSPVMKEMSALRRDASQA